MADWALNPEFEHIENDTFSTIRTQFSLPVVQAKARWLRPKRIFRLRWNNAITAEKDEIVSFYREKVGPAGTFTYQPVDPVPAPATHGTVSGVAQVTGSYAQRTYYYSTTWRTSAGETVLGPEKSAIVAANNLFRLTINPFPTNVTDCRVYIGTVSGSLTLQGTVAMLGGKFTEPDTASPNGLVVGASPPTANTATETVTVRFADDTLIVSKTAPTLYRVEMFFEEVL